jgi:hypothetical protein
MEIHEFWRIVDQARDDAGVTADPFDEAEVAEALVARLTALSLKDILDFDDLLGDVIGRLDTRRVALACQLITGFLSDDLFSSFRAGLVGLGHRTVEQIIADPDSLAEHPVVIDIAQGRCERMSLDGENLLFAASSAYARLSDGDEDAFWNAVDTRREAMGSGDALRPEGESGADDAEPFFEGLPRLSALLPPGRWASESQPVRAAPQAMPAVRWCTVGAVGRIEQPSRGRDVPRTGVQAVPRLLAGGRAHQARRRWGWVARVRPSRT